MEKLGIVLVIIGIVCFGYSMFEISTGGIFEEPKYTWLPFIGIPLMFVGTVLSGPRIQKFLLRREEKNIRKAAGIIGQGLREGMQGNYAFCTNCGQIIDEKGNFCGHCGTKIAKID